MSSITNIAVDYAGYPSLEALSAALQQLQGRFILLLNDVPEVRELFAWATIDTVELSYHAGGAGHVKWLRELIIGLYAVFSGLHATSGLGSHYDQRSLSSGKYPPYVRNMTAKADPRANEMTARRLVIGGAALFLIVWAYLSYRGVTGAYGCDSTKSDIWQGILPCLKVNELGDVLAGFFAPAAFLILGSALVLQGLQLQAQRDDLNETRSVMLLQLEQLRRQNGILEHQEALLREQESRQRIETHLDALAASIRGRLARAPFLHGYRPDGSHVQLAPFASTVPQDRGELLAGFSHFLMNHNLHDPFYDLEYGYAMRQVSELAELAALEMNRLRTPYNQLAGALGIDNISDYLSVLGNEPKGLPLPATQRAAPGS